MMGLANHLQQERQRRALAWQKQALWAIAWASARGYQVDLVPRRGMKPHIHRRAS